jgi:glucans biosynthesis protein
MASEHPRNTGPMRSSPRCGAKTRRGTPCASPAVRGKKRCRMHGGAAGSGAPRGNKNALKTGFFTAEKLAMRRQFRQVMRATKKLTQEMRSARGP